MHLRSSLTMAGLAAVAAVVVGSLALAGPASANVATDPVSVSASTITPQTETPGTTVTQPDGGEAQASSSSDDKWTGGAAKDLETGHWRATVTRGDETRVFGTYATEDEARKAGRKKAKELNGVVDGPGCEPPVLC